MAWDSRPWNPKAEWLKTWSLPIVVVLSAFAAMPWLIGPACPRHVVIATGSPSGAYNEFAHRYREILAREGITLEVRSTAGSIENTELLLSDESNVSLAIIQGGTASDEALPRLESLASLYLEPIWVFYRDDNPIERLTDLRGKRIAIGSEGSGTRAVALDLLRENNMSATTVPGDPTTTLPVGGEQAAQALQHGQVDAALFVISPHSPIVRKLLRTDGVRLMSFRRANAFRRKYPFLSSVTLSEGVIDLPSNTPATDIVLLAPTANLVARKDLHPALVPLLLKAVFEVHEAGNILEEPGRFPSPRHVEFPLNADARRYFSSGPSLLYRYLPFWIAVRLDQAKLMLLPLCTLLLPLLKAAPPIYRWRIRSRIYRWYRVLREVDQKLKGTGEAADLADDINALKRLETELAEVSVPLSYMQEFYNLRLHAAFVHDKLVRRDAAEQTRPVRRAG